MTPVFFFVFSMQQNDQIWRHQPLPLHGYDIHHLPAKGGLWLQGGHCAAGKRQNSVHDLKCWRKYSHAVLTENLLFSSTAGQESEQRGDELGPWCDLRLLQKLQHPLRTAGSRWAGTERDSLSLWGPLHSVHPQSIHSHLVSSSTTPLVPPSNPSSPCKHFKNCYKRNKEITIFL